MITRLLLLLASVAIVTGQHGKDSTVCQDPVAPSGVTAKAKPVIPDQFSAHIECVIKNKNMTIDMYEFYDQVNNQGRITQLQNGLESDFWYDYNDNEFITYFPSVSLCVSTTLSTSNEKFMFGYTSEGTTGQIFSAGKALHFNTDAKEVYMGTTMVRGIAVDVWKSCQYWSTFDATMTVYWYFTASTEWDTAIGQPVPVGAHVIGKVWDTPAGPGRPIEHVYDMFHFRTGPGPRPVFNTPPGVQCTGRKNTKPLPSVPNAFSQTVEVLDKTLGSVSYMTEYFSNTYSLVRYLYRPLPTDNSPFGTADLSEVHDFNTGVAYITDLTLGNCTAKPIGLTFDGEKTGPRTVRIRNSREFFYFNLMNFTYEGVSAARRIDTDTWIGTLPNFPKGSGGTSTWQWYFATTDWLEVNTGVQQGGTPVQMTVNAPAAGMNYEYHMFNFKNSEPDLLNYDISACYVNRDRRSFQMKFPGKFIPAIQNNQVTFRYYVLTNLMKKLNVTAVRISKLQVILDQDIVVYFEILDVAPLVGDVTNRIKETPLATAANTLINLINNNQFFISLHDDAFQNLVGMVPISGSLIETTYLWDSSANQAIVQSGSKKYGAGVMAAVGVVVPLVSAALGGVFAFFFFK